jgi:hypothetical protein
MMVPRSGISRGVLVGLILVVPLWLFLVWTLHWLLT